MTMLCPGVGVLSGQLYAAGGHDGPLVRKSVEVYDPHTNSWRLVCDMNMCRRNAGQIDPSILVCFGHISEIIKLKADFPQGLSDVMD